MLLILLLAQEVVQILTQLLAHWNKKNRLNLTVLINILASGILAQGVKPPFCELKRFLTFKRAPMSLYTFATTQKVSL